MPFLTEAMRKKTVFGNFSKFIYRCANADSVRHAKQAGIAGPFGVAQAVYCQSVNDFLKLVASWNKQSEIHCHGRYLYTFTSTEGVPMSLDQIASDLFVKDFSTTGSRVLKMVLTDGYTEVQYIQ